MRRLRETEEVSEQEQTAQSGAAPKEEKYLPYKTDAELPEPVVISKKHGAIKTTVGGYRYTVVTQQTTNGPKYKLIAMYKTPSGVCRKLEAVLMPTKRNKRGVNDKALLAKLKKAGVPGIV